ncbi:hypothetical protein DD238_008197 [Peronospora effusa]|uniref:Uncharacterized protein n=1 Tax=Peronospora effusa TaxID=542832 RepID=A0A3M6V7J6_9STRA|nr:hypothetical protein DD238_008197 [Peronospora effusa]
MSVVRPVPVMSALLERPVPVMAVELPVLVRATATAIECPIPLLSGLLKRLVPVMAVVPSGAGEGNGDGKLVGTSDVRSARASGPGDVGPARASGTSDGGGPSGAGEGKALLERPVPVMAVVRPVPVKATGTANWSVPVM